MSSHACTLDYVSTGTAESSTTRVNEPPSVITRALSYASDSEPLATTE
jgi:hypothetical protein